MLNQIVIIGKLTKNPIEISKDKINITLSIPRSYKNKKGEYETDFIDVTLCSDIASNTLEYCKKGDLVGIKGRVETGNIITAEKVTFLSSKGEK